MRDFSDTWSLSHDTLTRLQGSIPTQTALLLELPHTLTTFDLCMPTSPFDLDINVPAPTRPWPVKASNEDDNVPSTSQSWPPPSDLHTHPSFGAAGSELDYQTSPEIDGASWSPAAAFLSAFVPSPRTYSDSSSNIVAGYTLDSTIGHGGFSTIRKATSPAGGIVAVKIVRHSAFNALPPREKTRQRRRLTHEARVWVSLSHENILPLFDSHRTSDATYLITLYCPAGSLLDILKREGTPALEQTDAGCMFRQVIKALQYLHEIMFLVHGDVKLENVLVDETGVCRLTDFGLSRRIGGDSSQVSSSSAGEDNNDDGDDEPTPNGKLDRSKRAGTSSLPVHLSLMRHSPQRHRNSSPLPVTPPTHPDHIFQPGSLPYAAPELLLPHVRSTDDANTRRSRPVAHPAQDMWALGVLLYALLTGMLPFRDSFEPRLQMKILRGTYYLPHDIGPLAESVLKGCLERDLGERWSIAMVDDAAWGIGYGNVEIDPGIREEQRDQSLSRVPRHSRRSAGTCDDDLSTRMSACTVASPSPFASPSPSPLASPPSHSPLAYPPSLSLSPPHKPRGRPPRMVVRSQSRSPSPSVAPRTPDDEDDDVEGMTYFGTRRHRHRHGQGSGNNSVYRHDRHTRPHARNGTQDVQCQRHARQHDSSDLVQIVLQDMEDEDGWDARERVYDDDPACVGVAGADDDDAVRGTPNLDGSLPMALGLALHPDGEEKMINVDSVRGRMREGGGARSGWSKSLDLDLRR